MSNDSNRDSHTIDLDQFTYDLPLTLIAQEPLAERSSSRLLVLDKASGLTEHHHFSEIGKLLRSGDTLVLNDTKVIPARLIAQRNSGGMIKILLLKSEPTAPTIWQCMVTPIKRLKVGEILQVFDKEGASYEIKVIEIGVGLDGYKRLTVDLGSKETMWRILESAGYAPLPPYIARGYESSPNQNSEEERKLDLTRYQTVFAREPGAVAAPTAGLHFTDSILKELKTKGVQIEFITLHVGAGTFKPISTAVEDHKIEPERYTISEQTADRINQAKQEKRRVIAVGTTSLRALESSQRERILMPAENASTDLYIKPGYNFSIADALITNFHLSQSSLLVLVCAFAGRSNIMQAYKEAIDRGYRFYSYGDAMLIS